MWTRTIEMLFLIVAVICVNRVSAQYLQIEITNTTLQYGADDLDVLCHIINSSMLSSVFTIQLQRSGSPVVSVTPSGVSWQDISLQNRDLVTANGTVSDVMAAHLHMNIPTSSVVYPDDEGDYQCTMSGLDLMFANVNDATEVVFVNITGYTESTTAVETTRIPISDTTNAASSTTLPTSEAPSGPNAGTKLNVGTFIPIYSAIAGLVAIKNLWLMIL